MREKPLEQLLHEYASSPDADKRDRNRAAYLENREEILQALADGWSMRRIWDILKKDGRIDFSYSVFVHLTRRYRAAAAGGKGNPGQAEEGGK